MKFIKNFPDSWDLMWNKKILLIMLFDFFFFFFLFLIGGIAMQNLLNNMESLQEKGEILNLQELENTQESTAFFLSYLNELQGIISNIFWIIGLFIGSIFLLWCIFHGLNWMLTDNIINKNKINFKKFLKLNGISLIWFLVIIIFLKIFNQGLVEGLTTQEKTGTGIILIIFFLIIYYFLSINYSLFLLKENFKKSIKEVFNLGVIKFYRVIPVFFLILLIFLLLAVIFYFLNNIFWGFSIIGLIAFLLLISWSRIFILLNLKEFY